MKVMRARLAAVGVVAVLSGCAVTPESPGTRPQSASPVREALQYFPASAPVVALVETDPTAPQVRRLVSSGALRALQRFASRQGLSYRRHRVLLGNPAVVGQPHVGAPALAAVVVPDAPAVRELAEARVRAGDVTASATYRGATLYQSPAWAYAVRGPVLLVARNAAELVRALDTRVAEESFEASQLNAVLPPGSAGALARGAVDLRSLVALVPPAVREVPLLRALSRGGGSVVAGPDGLRAALTATTAPGALTADDLPEGTGPVRVGRSPGRATAGVADLGDLAVAAERAVRSALPVTGLQFDALDTRLQSAGVLLTPELLAGPAWGEWTPSGPRIVWRPQRPGDVAAALDRVARRYREPGVTVTREGTLLRFARRGRTALRVGFAGDVVVAGRAPARELIALASRPAPRLPGPAAARLPRRVTGLPFPLDVSLSGTPSRLTLRARSG